MSIQVKPPRPIQLPAPARAAPAVERLPFNPGDHLSRTEFERRYAAHPQIKKAELVEGVIYMPSPLHFKSHGFPHIAVAGWLALYVAATPGVTAADNATVRLDLENEVQPDALLRLEPAQGGKSRITPDDFVEGPPELIVEVAASSTAYDLHAKRRVYQRSGVQEYLAIQMYEQRADWFALREGEYALIEPDDPSTGSGGVLKSQIFPGLWLKAEHLFAGDLAALLATLQEGLACSEHGAFVARLQTPT
jgi:Uma2 family endonuclease